jgi:hypothetical protein
MNIEITDGEAAMFLLFRKYQDTFAFMLSCGVFDVKGGNVILSFDQAGRLKSVKRELFDYRGKGGDNIIPIP